MAFSGRRAIEFIELVKSMAYPLLSSEDMDRETSEEIGSTMEQVAGTSSCEFHLIRDGPWA